jgi:hypothetical protein
MSLARRGKRQHRIDDCLNLSGIDQSSDLCQLKPARVRSYELASNAMRRAASSSGGGDNRHENAAFLEYTP